MTTAEKIRTTVENLSVYSLRTQWFKLTELLNELDDYRLKVKELRNRQHQNMDYDSRLDEEVEKYIKKSGAESLNITPFWENEGQFYEEVAYITDVIAERRFNEKGWYYSNDTQEEIDNGDAERWFTEILYKNVSYYAYQDLYDFLEERINYLILKREHIIRDRDAYQCAFEGARDYLYYGESKADWVEANRDLFEDEDDMNFVWEVAFSDMADDDENGDVFDRIYSPSLENN